MAKAFFDSNVALYLLSSDPTRAGQANAILRRGGVVSAQVLNEFAAVSRGKYGLKWPEIRMALSLIRALVEVRPVTVETHECGVAIAERYGFRIFDSLLLASAIEAGCDTFWSEDLQHGQVINGALTIRNPFKS